MNKYAMIWTTNLAYMPGTNAILNALEFYKFTGIDVYILVMKGESLPEDYTKAFPDVRFEAIDLSISQGRDWYWYLVFSDMDYLLKNLLKTYEVVLLWGADVCVVNNFQVYFEIAEGLDSIVMGTNDQMGGNPDRMSRLSKDWPYRHTWDVPYADIPVFIPKSKSEFIEKIFWYQENNNVYGVDRMDGMNYAIRDLGEKVFGLPGVYWIFNVPHKIKLSWTGNHLYLLNHRMESFHRKYWDVKFCQHYMANEGDQEMRQHNVILFNRIWNFFNTKCRVQWTKGLEKWDGK